MTSSIPNVLAGRYASAGMRDLWSPEAKIIMERQLWIAVMEAQAELGLAVPVGAIDAYRSVLDKVNLGSIAERERVTKHERTASGRWHIEVRLENAKQVDHELQQWMRASYKLAE